MPAQIPLVSILVKESRYQSNKLRKRLIREGIKQRRCECCGITSWNGKPAPLELEHINGDKQDNRLENLLILCPNCHAQTDTYRGKNTKTYGGVAKSADARVLKTLDPKGRTSSNLVAPTNV